MDKFWSGMGFGSGGEATKVKASSPPDPQVNAEAVVTPKKTTLSLEEKQKLAKQQEQERALKSQQPLTPRSKGSAQVSTPSSTGPKDLTSTLMESNMRNLSMSAKPSGAVGNIGSSPGMTMSGAGGGTNWQPGAVNWGQASQAPQYMTPQPSSSSSASTVNLSSFDSLLTTSSSAKKAQLNQMAQPAGGMWPTGQQLAGPRPAGMGGMQSHQGWGQGVGSVPPQNLGYQQPPFGAFPSNPTANQGWGGSSMGSMTGMMQPRPLSQSTSQVTSKSLTSDDLKDLLG